MTTQKKDFLAEILNRKRIEIARRKKHVHFLDRAISNLEPLDKTSPVQVLKRKPGQKPHIIAEVKFKSPSAGVIRKNTSGESVCIAKKYVEGGASAVSVLADFQGFGGSVLNVRRIASVVSAPVLFKEFVLDPIQIRFAKAAGASMVLLLVRTVSSAILKELIHVCKEEGLEPLVEAANAEETKIASQTEASLIGINARDLQTFKVDKKAAANSLKLIPKEKISIFMSGISSKEDFNSVSSLSADAALIGEGLMKQEKPEQKLQRLICD